MVQCYVLHVVKALRWWRSPEQENGAQLQLITLLLEGTILPAIPQNAICSGAVLCQTCLQASG